MTIANLVERIKGAGRKVPRDILVFLIIISASITSFGIGYLSGRKSHNPVIFAEAHTEQGASDFVASKTGSRYYLPWCSGANKISEENKVHFSSEQAAEKAGYTPAKNCDGL